jgi:hypothetical protein
MIASAIAEYEQAFKSVAILPLVLGAIAAMISLIFDTQPDSRKNTIKKAWYTFIISGVAGTVVALVSVVGEQEKAEAADAQAKEVTAQLQSANDKLNDASYQLGQVTAQLQSANDKLNGTSNQLVTLHLQLNGLQSNFGEIADFLTNNPALIIENNNYYYTVIHTFENMQKIIAVLNTASGTAQNQVISAQIEAARQFLSSYRQQNSGNAPGTSSQNPGSPPSGDNKVPGTPSQNPGSSSSTDNNGNTPGTPSQNPGSSVLPSFTLTVINGSGGGSYTKGESVGISANAANAMKNAGFAFWSGGNIANTNAATTTVIMPASNLTVTACYTPYAPANMQVAPVGP